MRQLLDRVPVPKTTLILDVGCAGRWMVRRLAALASEGKVIGLDYSTASVAVSRETNSNEIDAVRGLHTLVPQMSRWPPPYSAGWPDS